MPQGSVKAKKLHSDGLCLWCRAHFFDVIASHPYLRVEFLTGQSTLEAAHFSFVQGLIRIPKFKS